MTTQEVNISNELKALEKKKSALEKVMKIARAVEQLRYGLEAVVLLGKPSAGISPQALHIFEALSDKIRIQPTKKIQECVQKLDTVIANNLNAIIELARPENHAELHEQVTADDDLAEQITKLIQDYRKNSQTAVALRVELRERGIRTTPANWSVNIDSVRAQITQLSIQETDYREKIKTNIVSLQHDALIVVNNNDQPQATREAAEHMHHMLQKDLDHLNAGKDIESMPYFVEVVELKDSIPAPHPDEQIAKQEPTAPLQPVQTEHKSKPGLIHRLWRWSTTAPSVTWQDIDKEQSGKNS